MRLFQKVLLLALVVSLVPLFSAGTWIALDASSGLRAAARAVQQGAADRSAALVASYLDNLRAVLDVAQRAPGLSDGSVQERRQALRALLDNYPQFEEVRLLDGAGRAAALLSRFRDADETKEDWSVVEADIAARGYHLGGVKKGADFPSLSVVVPVSGGGGRRLAARVNLLDMNGLLRGAGQSTGGLLYVLDAAGALAAHSAAHTDPFAEDFPPDPRARAIARQGVSYPGADGKHRLASVAPVPGAGWEVVFEQPADAALRVVTRARRRFALCLGAAALLAVALAFGLGRRLSAPLEEMRSAVKAMEEGRFDVVIHERSSDEIGSVAEALRRAQGALERRVRQATVGLMAQRIGHDMRQNLGAIRMRAETLKRRLAPGDAESAKGLNAIAKEVERGADYIEELLTFGRERPPALHPWDVNLLVKDVSARVAPRPGVTAVYALAEGLPPCGLDEGEVRRALTNLINNAHEAVRETGEVRVSTARVEGGVEVTVTDTGCGIPADKKDKIFEDFFSTKPTGTGLGMGIVKRVVERHGGAVTLDSEVGKGTRVTVSFPAWRPA